MKPEDWISVRKQKPYIGDFVLALAKDEAYSVQTVSCDFGDRFDFWMPLPMPPPKPDPFETWWKQSTLSAREFTSIRVWCKEAWDAALKSKEQGE